MERTDDSPPEEVFPPIDWSSGRTWVHCVEFGLIYTAVLSGGLIASAKLAAINFGVQGSATLYATMYLMTAASCGALYFIHWFANIGDKTWETCNSSVELNPKLDSFFVYLLLIVVIISSIALSYHCFILIFPGPNSIQPWGLLATMVCLLGKDAMQEILTRLQS